MAMTSSPQQAGLIRQEVISPTVSRFVVEPLEPGYGYTLGNALRRVLLSSLQGAAISEVEFNDVVHEYSSIEGVYEDVVDIILNLKSLVISLHEKEKGFIHLDVRGPGDISAAAFECDESIQIHNPDTHIAHLMDNAHLRIRAKVTTGHGYQNAADHSKEDFGIGMIKLDASYSPVRRVTFNVDNTRYKEQTNYDRLVLEVETNGSLHPEEALQQAVDILRNKLSIFSFENQHPYAGVSASYYNELYCQEIDTLGLSSKVINSLRSEGLYYIGDLIQKSERDLLKTPNLGKRSLSEIILALQDRGLTLGTTLEDWPPKGLVWPPSNKEAMI